MRYSYLLPFLTAFCLILIPLAHADFVIPLQNTPTFENQQNLILSVQITSDGSAILDQASSTIPIGVPVSLSYSIDHRPLWPSRNASADIENQLFTQTLSQQKLYLELWQGTPFTESAHMLQNWDITNSATGTISANFPESGPYFLITYLPDAFYQDPQSECPNDDNWETDCAPSYTLDQVRGYFSSSLISTSSEPFEYLPDAYGGIEFTVPTPKAPLKDSNVLFIPGIEGSRLYTRNIVGQEEVLWEPSLINTISELGLAADGTSIHKIYTRDLVDYLYGVPSLGDVYGPFEKFMNDLVANGTITAWQAYPYDWRYDARDIVANGTLVGNSTGTISRTYLESAVQKLALTSPTGKVTIIAHSNGGLLAKALAILLQQKNEMGLVDRIIFIGSPQFGTPTTVGALLNGDGQTDGIGGLVMYGGTVRTIAATMPSMYGLLPSANYFAHISSPLVLFPVNTINNLFEKYLGPEVNSLLSLETFVTDANNLRGNFPPDDLHTPLALSDQIFQKESMTHSVLDSWTPPSGLPVDAIAGWGNLTPFQYSYTSSNKKYINCFRTDPLTGTCLYSYQVHHQVTNTDAGDNTVVSPSAIGNAPTGFYFNAKTFSADKLGTIGHGDLTSAGPIQSLIKNLLANTSSAIPYISDTIPSGGLNPLIVVSVHSPVNIAATDSSGDQTGIFPVPDHPDIYYEKKSIPGSSVQILDDEKYLYLPTNQNYNISLQGYDAGATTVNIGSSDNTGNSTTTEEFEDIPTTASTTAEFSIQNSSATDTNPVLPSVINVDVFDDGTTTPIEAIAPSQNAGTTSTTSSGKVLHKKRILSILTKASTLYALGDAVKKQFQDELEKIESLADQLSPQDAINALEKLVQAQIGKRLSLPQGTFFLQFLDSLKT